MATRKDTPLVSSLGRVQGQKITREGNSSRDSLASHPLLSPPPAITTTTIVDNNSGPAGSTSLPESSTTTSPSSNSTKYVPYTPRHRVSTSQVTAQSSPPTLGNAGGVTPQLQLQNLKAAAQDSQLTSGSVGWAICEKLYQEGESSEWEDIWTAVTTNRATLLLPLDQVMPQENITADYVRDHVVYCTGPSNKTIPVVTVSGLRGFITDNTLTIRSVISTTSPQFQALSTPASRMSTLAGLPPLPSPLIVPLKPEYPVFNIPAPHTELPFPSRPHHKPQPRPVLSTPRLNPFANLFGARASPATTPAPLPASPSGEELESKSHSIDVSVYVIQGRILRKDVIKGISSSIKAELREALTGLPSWMVERSIAFTSSLHPQLPVEPKKPISKQPSSSSKVPSLIEPDMTDHTTASESFQSFYASLEDELFQKEQQNEQLSEKKADNGGYNQAQEDRRYQMVERVERAVCALFYDQLFRRKPSDDASHDEALSSRIAALNMLDLGLEHLGIDVGKAGNGVHAVVTAVGQALQRLQDPSCRAPVDKAAAIVAAHNVAVEGLSRLPPIRLKPDEEVLAEEPTPLASQFRHNANVQGEGDKRLPKSPLSPLPEDKPAELLSPTVDPASPSAASGGDAASLQSPTSAAEEPAKPTPVASDILLPFMIYSIVKANPAELVSHLLFTQRYRMRSHSPSSGAGEEAFCLINLLAVVEFLENVDLGALGLADSSRVLSVADLAPLPLSPNALMEAGGPDSPLGLSTAARLRGRVNQQVEELAGSANKVLSDVVDSSFSALKGLLSNSNATEKAQGGVHSPSSVISPSEIPPWNLQRPGFGLLRRGTEFTLASVTSSLPALQRVTTGGSRRGGGEESGQMLVEVPSRPESSIKIGYGSEEEEDGSDEGGSESDAQHSEAEDHANAGLNAGKSDARSIRSFGSMMSGESRDRRSILAAAGGRTERMSLSDRLANVSVRSRLARDTSSFHAHSPPSKRASLLGVSVTIPNGTSSRPTSPSFKTPGPNERFMECEPGDLKLSEVGELLLEYRRVVERLRALNGFDEPE